MSRTGDEADSSRSVCDVYTPVVPSFVVPQHGSGTKEKTMPRTAIRGALVVTSLTVGLLWLTVGVSGQNGSRPPRKANGPTTTPISRARDTRHSTRSTRPTSTSSRSRGASRPTTSARSPSKARGTPLMVNGVLHDRRHTAIGDRPRREDGRADLVAQLPRGSGPPIHHGSCRAAASHWTDGRGDERVLYVTTAIVSSR